MRAVSSGAWRETGDRRFDLAGIRSNTQFENVHARWIRGSKLHVSAHEVGPTGAVRHEVLDVETGKHAPLQPTKSLPKFGGGRSAHAEGPIAATLVRRKDEEAVIMRLGELRSRGDETFLHWDELRQESKGKLSTRKRSARWTGSPTAKPLGVGWDPHFGWAYVVCAESGEVRVYRRFVGAARTDKRTMSPDTNALVGDADDQFRLAFPAPDALGRSTLLRVTMLGSWLSLETSRGAFLARPLVEGEYVRDAAWLALPTNGD
jgi:hypothetical protein